MKTDANLLGEEIIKIRSFSKQLLNLALLLITMGLVPARTNAWGGSGHRIIARIASERLSKNARENIKNLLGDNTIESASVWADQIRTTRTDTEHWHFVDIPLEKNDYMPNRDCIVADKTCLIEAIERQITILENPNEQQASRADALKFLIHLIGDLHQPFHVSTNTNPYDNAGYLVQVKLFGQPTHLHKVWDSDLINYTLGQLGSDEVHYTNRLLSKGEKSQSAWERGTITQWALESHRLARDAYPPSGSTDLGNDYYEKNQPVLEAQLLKAGVRLAHVLNNTFR